MDNRFNFPKKTKQLPSIIPERKYDMVLYKSFLVKHIKTTYEIIPIPNTEKILLETKKPLKKKKKRVSKKRKYTHKLKLPMVIKETTYEIILVPNTEKILLETKRPYIPKRIYRLETKELLSDLNADFYEELKGYFVLELNKEYSRSLRRLLAPSARNLIPYIIRTRRLEYNHFLLKLYNADFSNSSSLINFTFVSVDEHNNYDFKFVFERIDGELVIKIDYS